MSEKLKPCPFCGNGAEIRTIEMKKLFTKIRGYFVECKVCKNRTIVNNKQESIEAWNRRMNDETN